LGDELVHQVDQAVGGHLDVEAGRSTSLIPSLVVGNRAEAVRSEREIVSWSSDVLARTIGNSRQRVRGKASDVYGLIHRVRPHVSRIGDRRRSGIDLNCGGVEGAGGRASIGCYTG